MAGYFFARANPDVLMLLDVLKKILQGACASRSTNDAGVEADRHHPRVLGAFFIEEIKRVAHVVEELSAFSKAARYREAHIVDFKRVWQDQHRVTGIFYPIREIIGIGI